MIKPVQDADEVVENDTAAAWRHGLVFSRFRV